MNTEEKAEFIKIVKQGAWEMGMPVHEYAQMCLEGMKQKAANKIIKEMKMLHQPSEKEKAP